MSRYKQFPEKDRLVLFALDQLASDGPAVSSSLDSAMAAASAAAERGRFGDSIDLDVLCQEASGFVFNEEDLKDIADLASQVRAYIADLCKPEAGDGDSKAAS